MPFAPAFREPKTAGFGLAAAVALTLVWSCSSTDPVPPDTTPASVTPVSGTNNQTAAAGAGVATAPSVTVANAAGTGLSGVSVAFTVTAGNGTVAGSPATTNANGVAAVTGWTLGTTAGNNTVTATVGSIVATFTATGTAGAAATMTVSAGDGQSAAAGTAVGTAPAVLISDQFTNPVSGVSVTFTPSGDGSVTASPGTTDASGVAAVGSWTLATALGANTLVASAGGVTDVTFNATGTLGLFNIAVVQGNDQTGPLTGPLPINPTVRVTDQGSGNPVSGVSVSFTPRAGEGTVDNATVVTDANGDAAVQWTPGRNGSNFMDVVAANASTQFLSIGSNSAYQIELVFLTGGETTAQKQAFGDAAGRWMDIIIGDVANFDFGGGQGANACGQGEPNVTGIIDDLSIFVKLEPIDGPGGILGAAGPCFIRPATDQPLTLVGVMRFDTADLANLETAGILGDVILHEMAHVIGSGTLWNQSPLTLLAIPSCPSTPGADTHFTGGNALAQFAAITGGPWTGTAPTTSPVPVENNPPASCPGSRDSHWRESTFATELMTPFIGGPGNPLSRTTIASMQDLGYAVDLSKADAYTLFSTTAVRATASTLIHLKDDIIRMPLKYPNGRLAGVVAP